MRDHVFKVPAYQRDYKWNEDRISQLFDDIDAAIRRGDERYFLGLMVFMKGQGTNDLIVLDGQQRLASTFLFLSACRGWMRQFDSFRADAEKIDSEFMGNRRFGEQAVIPRMVLNSANNECFNKYVVGSLSPKDLEKALRETKKHDRNRRLLENTVYCHKRIERMSEDLGSEACRSHLSDVMNYLNENVPVVSLTVQDEGTAFTIFETLNDRGMDLSPLDLVKNHLFRCIGDDRTQQRDLEHRWTQMMANLEEASPDQFIKVFWTSRHGRVQAHALYRKFTEEYSDQHAAVDVSADMLTASERYAAMSNSDDPVWAPYSEDARECVRALHILSAQQSRPVLLAALDRFRPTEMNRLLRLLEVLIVRYQFVGGGRTGPLEIECAKAAQAIHDGRITTASEVFSELRAVYPTDEQFNTNFKEMRKSSAAKTRYLFRGLERQARLQQSDGPDPGASFDSQLTVEHIWPARANLQEWPPSEEDPDDFVSLLGNLCLLPRNANRDVGNSDWETKKALYAGSQILLTKGLSDRYPTWDQNAIRSRQHYLAKLAVQEWRFQ